MPETDRSSLWKFSEYVYSRAGVQEALLWLQDNRQLDIPFFLFTLWTAYFEESLDTEALDDYLIISTDFATNVIHPIRESRRGLKTYLSSPNRLYQQILETELACEKMLLEQLESVYLQRCEDFARRTEQPGPPEYSVLSSALSATRVYLTSHNIDDAEAKERLAAVFSQIKQLPAHL